MNRWPFIISLLLPFTFLQPFYVHGDENELPPEAVSKLIDAETTEGLTFASCPDISHPNTIAVDAAYSQEHEKLFLIGTSKPGNTKTPLFVVAGHALEAEGAFGGISCKGKKIIIEKFLPHGAAFITYTFTWDGKHLKRKMTRSEALSTQ